MHKTFKGIAQRGKCSMGWFFGFKLHLICNEKEELLNFMITPGDVDDRKPLEYEAFVEFIYGKLVGDKGYIGKAPVIVHLGLTNCEYTKNLRTMYRRRAIFEQDLNFFVSFLRLFVEIS